MGSNPTLSANYNLLIHLFRLDGFRDEIHRARFEPWYSVLRVVECRYEDHGRVACFRVLLEAAARLVPVDARHDDVEQDEQWSGAAGDLQRILATVLLLHVEFEIVQAHGLG